MLPVFIASSPLLPSKPIALAVAVSVVDEPAVSKAVLCVKEINPLPPHTCFGDNTKLYGNGEPAALNCLIAPNIWDNAREVPAPHSVCENPFPSSTKSSSSLAARALPNMLPTLPVKSSALPITAKSVTSALITCSLTVQLLAAVVIEVTVV